MSTTPCVIDMLGDTIYLEVDGVHQDWKTYKLELDIKTPGRKMFAFRIKELPVKDTSTLDDDSSESSDAMSVQSDSLLTSSETEPQKVTVTECRILKRFRQDQSDQNVLRSGLPAPLHVVGYVLPPIATAEEIVERIQKRVRLS
ncbi:hypothetical protein EV363DRAFT_1456912 [Boletus edulis]|nr:hypothetical protein EV363DRAFT_1456912 [Boletus edulis]